MKSHRIPALILAAALTLVAIGYNVGADLSAALESHMSATVAHAAATTGE